MLDGKPGTEGATSALLTFLGALRRTGAWPPRPGLALLTVLKMLLRHGLSLYTMVAWQASLNPQKLALVDDQGELTYRELQALADRMMANLVHEAKAGDTVGLLARNSRSFVAALLACGRLGLRVVLLNTTFSAGQLAAVARGQQLSLLLHDTEFKWLVGAVAPPVRVVPLEGLLTMRSCPRLAPRVGQLKVLTSGSTGTPKAVQREFSFSPQRWAGLLVLFTALLTALKLRAGQRTLLPLPLFHGHGLATLAMCLGFGAPLVLTNRNTAGQLWTLLQQQPIEVLVLVPTLLFRLLQEPEKAPHLRTIVCGSAPLAPELATRTLNHFGDVLFNLYGSTEAGLISLATPADLRAAPASVGRVLPGVQISLQGGEIGCVMVQSPLLPDKKPLNTGDVGRLDQAGRLYLLGRADDLLICGGENVYPEQLEERLASLPYVQEAAVRGVPDAEYGQAIEAFVVRQAGAATESLAADLAELFPRTLRPKHVYWCDFLPRNALGKLLRCELAGSSAATRPAETSALRPASGHWYSAPHLEK